MAEEPIQVVPASQARPTYEIKAVPLRERIVWALASILFLPLLLAIPLTLIEKVFTPPESFGIAWLIVCYAIGFHVAWKTFRKKETTELVPVEKTAEQIQAEKEAAEEAERKSNEFFDKWWVRYPMGVGLLWVAGYLYDTHPNNWVIPLIIALIGVLALRELLLIGIGIGAIWLLVQGIASLPISLAIVLGAIIIASAINNRG